MTLLSSVLVNETIVEAVRVALERFTAEGHQLMRATSDANMPVEQESVIRRAILAGLQDFCAAVQQKIPAMAAMESTKGYHSDPDSHLANEMAVRTPPTLAAAFARLARNASATQELVQQVFSIIVSHLRNSEDRREGHIESPPSIVLYAATPEVTEVVEAAAAAQPIALADNFMPNIAALPMTPETIVAHLRSFSPAQWVWLSAALLLGYLLVRFIVGRLLGFCCVGSRRRPRMTTVLIGLPNSGKTALFAQLVHHQQLLETRTSMCPNTGYMFAAAQRGRSKSSMGIKVVDCPGHPRLYEGMLEAVNEAANVVVVIDSVTVHDPQEGGVAALAELLTNVLQTPEFYGVRRLLFACTKRDEVISYASKAVCRLLEAAMVVSIESRQNAVGRVESVRDVNNKTIISTGKSSGGSRGGNRRFVLSVDYCDSDRTFGEAASGHDRLTGSAGARAKSFSFQQLGIPVDFVDVSSRPNTAVHSYSTAPIKQFLQGHV
ncbi:hypothetical protein JKF63_02293 [Porcisia hertigi]|uniref:Signal recognition particle receptor subunit beta n=1 Tax=Porcisia hertigi TaxID=2761500 RepID=A0A836IIE0_9TRYP|nr:hypothetical protein JKF63_02293 [Porcisia hertigi]